MFSIISVIIHILLHGVTYLQLRTWREQWERLEMSESYCCDVSSFRRWELFCREPAFNIHKIRHHFTDYLTANTHTHPFNGPISGTTRVSRYQKGKTNLDLTEATDSEWQWHQLGHMQVCTSLQTDNHASTPPLSFLQADSKHSTKIWSRKAQTQIGLFRIMQDNFAKKIPTMSCYSGRVLDKKSTKIRIRSKCR